jgi:hypothetical protein
MKSSDKMAQITDEVVNAAVEDGAEFEIPKVMHHEPEFNMAVGQVLTKTNQLQAFRNAVTTKIARQVVPFDKQVDLARMIVQSITEDVRVETGRPMPVTAHEVEYRTRQVIMNYQGIKREVIKIAINENAQLRAKHEWSFLRNKMSHMGGHAKRLSELLNEGIRPEGFDPLLAEQFFKTEYRQLGEQMEKLKKLMSIYFQTKGTLTHE